MSTKFAAAKCIQLRLNDISKSFGDIEVLKDLNFDEAISALAIIGPSGGGKSTLLRIIGGLLSPTHGTMAINSESIDFDESSLLSYRKRIGYVFQDGGLFHHMTALENIAVPLEAVHGIEKTDAIERAQSLLSRLGVEDVAEKHPAQLSGGQKQRVAIARAIAPRPELLLLDEPTSALDPEFTNEVLDVIRDLKEEGARFIIVTHEMGFARHACDDVAFLSDGRLLEYGSSKNIFDNPQTPELRRFLSRLLEWSV